MLNSIILGILTIVLALGFSLLHLAAAFAAMKEKNYCQGNMCILSHLTSSCYLFLRPTCNCYIMGSGL